MLILLGDNDQRWQTEWGLKCFYLFILLHFWKSKIGIAKPCLTISGCSLWGLILLTTFPPPIHKLISHLWNDIPKTFIKLKLTLRSYVLPLLLPKLFGRHLGPIPRERVLSYLLPLWVGRCRALIPPHTSQEKVSIFLVMTLHYLTTPQPPPSPSSPIAPQVLHLLPCDWSFLTGRDVWYSKQSEKGYF